MEIDPQDQTFTLPAKADVVFLALHGAYGEDGGIQRELDALGVPYTGCGAETSGVAFDKVLTKEHCVSADVPTPPFAVLNSVDAQWPAHLEPPAVLKPVCQGSSVGLHFIQSVEQWRDALRDCLQHDSRALLERWIPGRFVSLGTDGYGRSDGRAALRKHFEVDRRFIAVSALKALADDGVLDQKTVVQAIQKYGIDPDRPNPVTL